MAIGIWYCDRASIPCGFRGRVPDRAAVVDRVGKSSEIIVAGIALPPKREVVQMQAAVGATLLVLALLTFIGVRYTTRSRRRSLRVLNPM